MALSREELLREIEAAGGFEALLQDPSFRVPEQFPSADSLLQQPVMRQGDMQRRRDAIASIESAGSGDYQAIGPTNERLGRAMGRYQIMEANIGPWSREALGRTVTPDEFLANPAIQDAIFDAKFGSYVDRFGEEGAAQAWFAGPGGVGKTDRQDVLGTDVGSYGQRYLQALGRAPSSPVQLAADTSSMTPAEMARMLLAPAPEQAEAPQERTPAQIAADLLAPPTDQPSPAEVYRDTVQAAAPIDGPIIPRAYDSSVPLPEREDPGFFDITREATAPFTETLGAVGESLTGGPSIGAGLIPEGSVPEFARQAGGRVLDVGLGAAAGVGALYGGLTGLAGDVAEGLGASPGSARRLTRDLSAMPEAFAASIGGAGARATRAGRRGVVDDAARISDDIPPQAAIPPVDDAATVADDVAQAAGDVAQAAIEPAERSRIQDLMARAARGNNKAREELIGMARVNPEAAAAAERLGISAPADVFSDNTLIQKAAGGIRATTGSQAEADWVNTLTNAQGRAIDLMRQEGSAGDISIQAEMIRSDLTNSIDTLRREGGKLFDDVERAMPVGQRVQPSETIKVLNDVITQLGGTKRLSPQEKSLFEAITGDDGMTYGLLKREKAQIARAAFRGDGPYKDADQRVMTQLYDAITKDQANFVETFGGSDVAAKLARGNELWSDAKRLEDDLISGFGKDAQGSIAPRLTAAIRSGSKGNIEGINKIVDAIPEGLRRESILTAIEELSTKGRSAGFSFADYANLYRGLRGNSKVYAKIAKELGPETTGMLQDLFSVSARLYRAEQNVPKTGKANQALIIQEGVLGRILDSSAGQAFKTGVGGMVGGALGGPLGTGVGAATAGVLKFGNRRAEAVSRMLSSPEFQQMVNQSIKTGQVSEANIQKVTNSPAYRRWARAAQIENPDTWLANAVASQQAAQQVESINGR